MTQYCSSPFLVTFLPAVRKIIVIIQIIVPILLIIAATLRFLSLMKDPEQKNGTKKIVNMVIAAVIIFFIPMFIDVVMGMLGTKTTISSCWKNAKEYEANTSYIDYDEEKKHVLIDPERYEKGNPKNQGVGAGPANSISDKTDYANKALNVVKVVNTNANSSGKKYRSVQAACYNGRHVVYAQNTNYGTTENSSKGGRICWSILETGEQVKCVDVGEEGGHMDGLAYDNDRGYVLKTSTNKRLMLFDNVTMEFKGYSSIDNYHVGITYVPSIHMLVGYSGGSLIFYKYSTINNKYKKEKTVPLKNYTGKSVQGLGTDGTNIFIADSSPYTKYRRLYTYSITGEKLETLSFGSGFGSLSDEVEAAFADNNGVLYLACPLGIAKVNNYVANKIGLKS